MGTKRRASDAGFHADGDGMGNEDEMAGDAAHPPPKRPKGADSPEETESSDSKPAEPSQSPTDPSVLQTSSKAHGGWNRGVNSGLRTSFAGKDKRRNPASRPASESAVQLPLAESTDIERLAMPSGDADFSKLFSRGNAWQPMFTKWCVRLMALNRDQEGLKDAELLRGAWASWLESQRSLSRNQQAVAVDAAAEMSLEPEQLQRIFSEALEADLEGPWHDSLAEAEHSPSPPSEPQSNGARSESSNSTPQGNVEASDWVLPAPWHSADLDVPPKDQHAWEEKFVVWCKSLSELNNQRKIKAETTRERNRITEAYLKWTGTIDGLSKSKTAAARRAAVQYALDNSALLLEIFSPTSLLGEPGAAESASSEPGDAGVGLLDAADIAYREKYFPGIGPNESFCHLCASRGHDAAACPNMACRFCRDPEHRSFACPTRRRCAKCKQLGHVKKDCSEKLALPQDEVECAFCGSRDHLDAFCHELWRSFSCVPDAVHKVQSLPVYCYCCGRPGHHGPVCGLNPQKLTEGPWETWCQSNCDRYLDPASSAFAIIGASVGAAPLPDRPDFGKSIVPKRHIFFEEADEDDEDFIQAPVQKSQRFGNISFSGGNGGGSRGRRHASRQYNDRGGRGGYSQPPLPPGPPPPSWRKGAWS
ncbi:hypothetical protein C8A05DRAFT_15868 [Staphylotrichum tortipilum]|uniref:CCHC-type domain-containing protein n=1 Tax=Staphylotrichum tortipilum TaxID=2831512 RepID=A0AAN6MKQ4_9PEZI|nr:hypothetical protein C8A05DRAFT_15868 [Staphylotrichum longicolle]